MADTALDLLVSIPVTTVQQTSPPSGLGAVCVLTPEGATPLSPEYTSYTSATAIAAGLSAGNITAQGAEDLTTVLAQDGGPTTVWVATYDDSTETPDAAADRILAAKVADIGIFVCSGRDVGDIDAMGTWMATRLFRYMVFAQSADSSLITGSPTSSLDNAVTGRLHLAYATATEPTAAGIAGAIAGVDLTQHPVGGRVTLNSVAAETGLTRAQQDYVIANHLNLVTVLDQGSSVKMTVGHVMYDGTEVTVYTSAMYLRRRLLTAYANMLSAYASRREPIPANNSGIAAAKAVARAECEVLRAAGHFTPGSIGAGPAKRDFPDGYDIIASVSGGIITVRVDCLIAGEFDSFSVPLTMTEAI